jgi:hypothetical protein
MFQLHDRTRRRINLLVFLFLCVVPTAAVTGWGVSRRLPGRVQAEARRLEQLLRLKVTLEAVEYPRPGMVRYRGLELADPGTSGRILSCRELEAGWQKPAGGAGQSAMYLALVARRPELDANQISLLWRLVDDVLSGRNRLETTQVRAAAESLTLVSGDLSQSLTDIHGRIRTSAERGQCDLGFRLAELKTAEPIRVRIVRSGSTDPPVTGFETSTGGAAVPCSWVSKALPGFRAPGAGSTFTGRIWASWRPGGWDGEVAGQFAQIDLERLAGDRTAHQITGKAQCSFNTLRFHQGRISELSGWASAGPGRISRSLVDALEEHLDLVKGLERSVSDLLLPYEQLAMWFSLNQRGLHLRGRCESQSSGVILADEYGPILGESGPEPVPLAGLVRALVPPGASQVPATRQAEWLMRWLPLPEATQVKGGGAAAVRIP